MNERGSMIAALVGTAVIIIGIGWFLISFGRPARTATHEAGETVDTAHQMGRVADQLEVLNKKLATGALQAPASAPGALPAAARQPMALDPGEIPVHWIDQPLPIDDPLNLLWNDIPPTSVAIEPQQTAMPMLDTPVIDHVDVRALTNGRQIAWLVSWADATADYHVDTDQFCDAVALQLPLTPNAAYTMGDKDFRVQIIQWKALWQKDIDEHFQDVQDLHPNYWTDLYWFADGEFPFRVPDDFQRPESHDYFIAYTAGNPVSDFNRAVPVQELAAEGFGTLTAQIDSASVGRGVWSEGQWNVVIARPMATNDSNDFQFEPGTRNVAGFAVWEGTAANVGGRKHHSQWVVFEVQK